MASEITDTPTGNPPAGAWLKAEWTAVAVIGIAYVIVFVQLAPAVLQDYPDHLARAVVIGDLAFHHGSRFGAVFEYRFMAVPYILHDLLLAGAVEVLGVANAAIVWQVLVLLSLPAALLLYARATDIRREDQALAFLLGLYLATGFFYLKGFLAFGLAQWGDSRALDTRSCADAMLVIHALRLLHGRARARPSRPPVRQPRSSAPALAVSTAIMIRRRRVSLLRASLLLLPLIVLFAWHFGAAIGHPRPEDAVSTSYHWGSLLSKAQGIELPFLRFSLRSDLLMLLAFIVCFAWPYRTREGRHVLAEAHGREMGALALTYFGVYIVMPHSLSAATWVDIRAIPLVAIFLLMRSLVPAGRAPSSTPILGNAVPALLAALLAVANLVYLGSHLRELDAWLARYRSVVSAIPAGSYVLPIYTNRRERPIKSTLHAAAFTAIDRGAFIPYLFSGNRGEPMTYFRYKQRPYAPEETWYVEPAPAGCRLAAGGMHLQPVTGHEAV